MEPIIKQFVHFVVQAPNLFPFQKSTFATRKSRILKFRIFVRVNLERLLYGFILVVFIDVEAILRGSWRSVKMSVSFTGCKQVWVLLQIR